MPFPQLRYGTDREDQIAFSCVAADNLWVNKMFQKSAEGWQSPISVFADHLVRVHDDKDVKLNV